MPPDDKIADLQQQIDLLNEQMLTHYHDGNTASRLDMSDLIGIFETISVAPTHIPHDMFDQIKIYVNGATLRLYWYDATGHTWHYVTATA